MARLIFRGGPADATESTLAGATLPGARYFALPGERAQAGRWVTLARYVLTQAAAPTGTWLFQYTGTQSRMGPIPSDVDTPGWSN